MKSIYILLAADLFVTPLAALELGEVAAVARKFSGTSPDEQYAARVELNALVDQATAPGKDRAAATKTLVAAIGAADTPAEAKKYLLRALVKVGTAEAIPALTDLLNEPDAILKEEARLTLEFIPDPKAVSALEGELAHSTDKREKIALANSLAIQKAESAVPAISALVVDSDLEIARAGIAALAKIGGSKGVEALTKAHTGSQISADLKPDIEKALLIASGGDAATAGKIYSATACPVVKLAAFKVAAAGDDKDALIEDALKSEDSLLRQAALMLGLKSNLGSVQTKVAQSMDQFAPGDRLVVLSCIECVKPADTAEKIALACAASEDADEKAAAIAALGKFGTKPAFDAVLGDLAGGDRKISEAAGAALATMPYANAGSELLGMLKSGSSEDKIAAIKAAGYRLVDGANAAMLDIVKSDDKAAAKEALKVLYLTATGDDLATLVEAAKAASDPAQKKLLSSVCAKVADRLGTDEAKNLVKGLQ